MSEFRKTFSHPGSTAASPRRSRPPEAESGGASGRSVSAEVDSVPGNGGLGWASSIWRAGDGQESQPLIDSRYRPLRKLGHGGAGNVLAVADTFQSDRLVALKLLDLEADELRRELLAREFYHLTKLAHPNLVKVYDFGVEPRWGRCYFTMELVEGPDLLAATQDRKIQEIYPLVAQICRALGYIHDLGYLHNDIKPGNILVADRDGRSQVRLLDFGLASLRPREPDPRAATKDTTISGTLHYLAPEVLRGQAPNVRSDLYALGVLLYELFTRRHPFHPDDGGTPGSGGSPLSAVAGSPPQPSALAPELPAALSDLLLGLLSARPKNRPASAHQTLALFNEGAGTSFQPETPETLLGYVHGGHLLDREAHLAAIDSFLREAGLPALGATSEACESVGIASPLPNCSGTATPPETGVLGPMLVKGPKLKDPGGCRSLLLIVGKDGMGKTRLLEEIRVRAQLSGLLPLGVRAAASSGGQYWAIRRILGYLVRSTADDPGIVDRFLEEGGAGALKLMPDLRPGRKPPVFPQLPAAQEEQRLFEQVSRFFLALAAQRPCLVLIDDLQVLDEGSLRLLGYLARSLHLQRRTGKKPPVLLLATCKAELADPLRGKEIEKLAAEPFAAKIEVKSLPASRVQALIGAMFGLETVPESLVHWVTALSEGNPLFIVELFEFLLSEGHIQRIEGRWKILVDDPSKLEIPKGLSDIIATRLERLEPPVRRVFQILAALGRPVLEPHLVELSDVPQKEAKKAIDALVSRRLAVERRLGARRFYELEQPAKAQVIYPRIPEEQRQQLHLSIARHLARCHGEDPAHAEELARHYVLAGELAGACRPAWVAGNALRKTDSNKTALEMYQIVADAFRRSQNQIDWQRFPALLDGTAFPLQLDELVQLHRSSCDLAKKLGRYQEAVRSAAALLHLGHRVGDGALVAHGNFQIGWACRLQGNYDRAVRHLGRAREAFQRIDAIKDLGDTFNQLGNLRFQQANYVSSLEYYQQSLGIRMSCADRLGIAESYNNIGSVYFYMGNYNQSMSYYRRALEIRRELGDQYGIGKNLNNIGLIYYKLGDLDQAKKFLRESLELKRSMSERAGWANTLSNLAEIDRTQGNFKKSYEAELESLAIKQQIGDIHGQSISASNLGIACTRLGRYGEAFHYLSSALQTARRIGFRALETEVLCNLAETQMALGSPRQAMAVARQALALANRNASRPDQMSANLTLAQLHLDLEHPDEAMSHLHMATQLAGELSNAEKLASALLLTGRQARQKRRGEEALQALDKAYAMARDLKSRYLLAEIQLERTWASLEMDRVAAAAQALQTAKSCATRIQCPELQWRLQFAAAEVHRAARQLPEAFRHYGSCVEILRQIAASLEPAPLAETYLADPRRSRIMESLRSLKEELHRLVGS